MVDSNLFDESTWPQTQHAHWMSRSCVLGRVSVIIPTYNRSLVLTETVQNVFVQSYRPIELLIVDDGSTDDTKEFVDQFVNKHRSDQFMVRYLRQENAGAPAARNLGLIESTGEFIQFLDSDDLLHPSKIERQVHAFECHPSCSFVYGYTTIIQKQGLACGRSPSSGWYIKQLMPETILEGSLWYIHAGLYRREICRRIGPWDESIALWQDWEYAARLGMSGIDCQHIPEILSYCRVHEGKRISQGFHGNRGYDRGQHMLRMMKERASLMTDFNRRIRCAIAASFLRSIILPLKEDSQKNLDAFVMEIRSLDPCPICRLYLTSLLLARKLIGGQMTAMLLTLTQKVVGKLVSLRVKAQWKMGFKIIKSPRWTLHVKE